MSSFVPQIFRKRRHSDTNADVAETASRLRHRYEDSNATAETRAAAATTLVNEYYDIVTDFYEYGWGQSFHFATRYSGESFGESIARHEHFLALQGNFRGGQRVLDIGCGVGGPARRIAQFSGAHVTGINNNAYQITRAQRHDSSHGMSDRVDYIKADFCSMPVPSESYDGAYAIEATCHAQDRKVCFGEVWRCLRPGATFVVYEWVLTDAYDDNNEEHRRIRHGIELGDGLPSLTRGSAVTDALVAAGFEVEEAYDIIERDRVSGIKHLPWFHPLQPNYHSLTGLKASPIGRSVTSTLCSLMEFLRIAPSGSRQAADILEEAAINLVRGGVLGIFTPAYFVRARKAQSRPSTECKA